MVHKALQPPSKRTVRTVDLVAQPIKVTPGEDADSSTQAPKRAGTSEMELLPSVLIAFAAGVYAGALVMAMMFVASGKGDTATRSGTGD